MSSPHWPLFDLRVRTPRLELRYPDDDDGDAIASVATQGIHDPATMPFFVPWTRAESPALERSVLQFVWSRRAALSPSNWSLPFVVYEGAHAVGVQDLYAKQFSVTRAVESGSWLVQRVQGRGIGTEMRAAVLHLAFAELDAREAYSDSFEDNPASEGVSRANGYEANGSVSFPREGAAVRSNRWILTRERWLERRRDDIRVEGLEPCLDLLRGDGPGGIDP